MRLLQIALIVLVSSSLIVYHNDSVAAAGKHSSKGHKSNGRGKGKRHKADANPGDVWQRIRAGIRIPRPSPEIAGFGQIVAAKNKNLSASSSEVTKTTESPKELGTESSRLTSVITPKKLIGDGSQLSEKLRVRQTLMPKDSQLSPADNYTRLGRLKLAPKGSSISLNNRLSKKIHLTPDEKLSLENNCGLFKSSSVQRIRTRLGLHPELFKGGEVGKASASDKAGSNSRATNQGQPAIRGCSDLNKQNVINLAKQGVLTGSYSQMAEQCQNRQRSKYERLTRQIAGYSQRKGVLYQASERARPYLYHIVSELSKHKLPLDLALLPIVESAYQPTALSPMSAAGIWQFIPSTGREYGLEQRADYDGRLDITASTRAAIRFLSGLNAHFKGDWLLSLAAYNSGQGTVDAAIKRNQEEGLDTDFWSLALPAETQDYVPRLLALAAIFESPGSYGLKLRPIKNEPYFIKVDIDRETDINHLAQKDLKTIAKLADFEAEQFGLLNSAYLKSTITESRPFTLLMPISNANLLHKSLAFMTQSGEVEEKIAFPLFPELALTSEYIESKIQLPLLAINLNEDKPWPKPTSQAAAGVKPMSANHEIKTATATGEGYLAVHYLDKGESLREVAENHGISEVVLRAANKLKRRQSISLGQRLLIPLKQITAATMSVNKMNTSVLYKGIKANLNPLSRL
jgi:soluble lytic murein transglycosylase-like protein/LysM repeat protein